MFIPVDAYIYNEEDGLYYQYEVNINPEHIESFMADDTIEANCTYVFFTSGQQMVIIMSVEEFDKRCAFSQIRTLLS